MARTQVRTVTIGFNLESPFREDPVLQAADQGVRAKQLLEEHGFQVQGARLCTQPFPEYVGGLETGDVLNYFRALQTVLGRSSIYACGIGPIRASHWDAERRFVDLLPELLAQNPSLAATIDVLDDAGRPHDLACRAAAEVTLAASRISADGTANLHFAALASCPPNTPFFPAAYHSGGRSGLSVGLQSAAMVQRAFKKDVGLDDAEDILTEMLSGYCTALEGAVQEVAGELGLEYLGIDLSPAPGKEASIADAVEQLSKKPVGEPGTLSVLRLITNALARVPVKRCGYSGLMIPVLEDVGLALRNVEGYFDIPSLLSYSSVCGTGLDTIPIPGDSDPEVVAALIRDVASLSAKLHKPLSARLFPIPGLRAGEITNFRHRVLVNTAVMGLSLRRTR